MQKISEIQEQLGQYSIFYSTLSKDAKLEISGTGDIDYTRSISDLVNQKYPLTSLYIQHAKTEAEIFDFIAKHKTNDHPILHITLNAPFIGFGFSEAGLKRFKDQGGRIIITAVEFKKHPDSDLKKETLKLLQYADSIIFLDTHDKNDARKTAQSLFSSNTEFIQKLDTAATIPVPATVKFTVSPLEKRGLNIGFFGILRRGQGLSHLIRLARLLKAAKPGSILENRKVIIMGSALDAEKLIHLMTNIYPEQEEDILACDSNIPKLKKLLLELKDQEKSLALKANLPIDLNVDVSDSELAPLFNQCNFFFQPKYRGATFRFTSISTLLSMGYNIFSHRTDITPEALYDNGIFSKGMILFNETFYKNDNDDYATAVLSEYELRLKNYLETDKTYVVQTTASLARKLYNDILSPKVIIHEFKILYERALARPLATLIPLDISSFAKDPNAAHMQQIQSRFPALRAFRIWSDLRPILRSAKKIHQKTKIDFIEKLGEGISLIRKHLIDIEKEDIDPKLREHIHARLPDREYDSKKYRSMLTPDEVVLYKLFINYSLIARHVTHNVYLRYIQMRTNELLSCVERERRGIEGVSRHTPDIHGLDDQVFFSIGDRSKNGATAYFLDIFDKVICFNLTEIQEKDPMALKGAWVSDHWPSYREGNSPRETIINGVTFRVEFQKDKKILSYIMPDRKTVYKQEAVVGGDIFPLNRVNHTMGLLAVDFIRHLGLETYQSILENVKKYQGHSEDNRQFNDILQLRFYPGLIEGHKPRQLRVIDQPGVHVVNRLTPQDNDKEIDIFAESDGSQATLMELRKLLDHDTSHAPFTKASALLREIIINILKNEFKGGIVFARILFDTLNLLSLLQSRVSLSDGCTMSVLGAALLSGREEILEAVLSNGSHINVDRYSCLKMGGIEYSGLEIAMRISVYRSDFSEVLSRYLNIYPEPILKYSQAPDEPLNFKPGLQLLKGPNVSLKMLNLLVYGPQLKEKNDFFSHHRVNIKAIDIANACTKFAAPMAIKFLLAHYKEDRKTYLCAGQLQPKIWKL